MRNENKNRIGDNKMSFQKISFKKISDVKELIKQGKKVMVKMADGEGAQIMGITKKRTGRIDVARVCGLYVRGINLKDIYLMR